MVIENKMRIGLAEVLLSPEKVLCLSPNLCILC